ncbi:methylated-DNA--[protein]-cysteine S-methyltransferase [Paenibacillus sp. P22]|uniref:methylated-DNA--[protein]-cysteine S-methyltransferase n=1 Tax=Paenibacillus sp. P22 TaxID=483908 RepID=UPI00041EFEA2|nr:methylated-DNA--[protein]-cysteine S-methyltransferase [Paenibacillus sp. P22]CDN41420.1 Methylated-DNA--protein-cysteine methyltransferase, constitutive [Paenibacillus sp. P22]
MNKPHRVDLDTPIGVLMIVGTDEGVQSILFSDEDQVPEPIRPDTPRALMDCRLQMEEYFRGERRRFTFPCAAQGTDFQKNVWQALTDVPYAHTVSYKDIAVAIGNEKAIRAVGSANGKNRLRFRGVRACMQKRIPSMTLNDLDEAGRRCCASRHKGQSA